MAYETELLEHGPDPGVASIFRRLQLELPSIERYAAGVSTHSAGEDLDERALAGTVLTYDAVHFSALTLNRGADKCSHTTERLVNVDEGQSRNPGPRQLLGLGQLLSLCQLFRLVQIEPV